MTAIPSSALPLPYQVLLALIIDYLWGDPQWLTHPVVIMGKMINCLERNLRQYCHKPSALRAGGALLAAILIAGSWAVTWLMIKIGYLVHPWLGTVISIWLLSTTLAARSLDQAARAVAHPLARHDLPGARHALSMIVGRDTATLSPSEIIRGVVETVAENTVDGILTPLFYALIGGAPLAMAFKAVSTLDSMVGHLNERYRYLGWASARLDDWANLIPARGSVILLTWAAWLRKLNWGQVLATAWRDAHKHPSPNGGWPEASVAGALEVRLGGINYYDSIPEQRAYLGKPLRPLEPKDIEQTLALMWLATWSAAILGCLAAYYFLRW